MKNTLYIFELNNNSQVLTSFLLFYLIFMGWHDLELYFRILNKMAINYLSNNFYYYFARLCAFTFLA